METGRGTLLAPATEGASCEPNTARAIPGAYARVKDAAFARPEMKMEIGAPGTEVGINAWASGEGTLSAAPATAVTT
jgi:hypothetical protein